MALGGAFRHIGLGSRIGPKPANGDDVQRAVCCSITASVEAMASRLATMGKPKPEQDEKGRFISGNSGGGRPKGSRNQLGEAVVDDLYADWLAHGVATIEKVRAAKPADYLKVIASMVPKDLKVSAIESMTDDELKASIERLLADVAERERSEPTEH
jgi:hypothetical protein